MYSFTNSFILILQKILYVKNVVDWGGGKITPPTDAPVCGFFNELCPPLPQGILVEICTLYHIAVTKLAVRLLKINTVIAVIGF